MLKGLLLSMILLGCAGAGRMLSGGRKRRMELLAELLSALRVLRLRVLNSPEPLGILLRKSDAALFSLLGNRLWEGEGLSESWAGLREEQSRRGRMLDCLNEEDMRLLDDFFRGLGGSGREEQNQLFAEAIARMEEAHGQAKRMFREGSKTYTALGALVGVGICIIIV